MRIKKKDFLIIIFLNIFLFNVSNADEKIILKCEGVRFFSYEKSKNLSEYSYKTIIDLKKKTIKRSGDDSSSTNIIVNDEFIYEYFIAQTVTGIKNKPYSFSVTSISRVDGKLNMKSNVSNETGYQMVLTELDKINKKIKNYKNPSLKYIEVSHLGSFSQELEKYRIIEDYIETIFDKRNYTTARWQCNKSEKAF